MDNVTMQTKKRSLDDIPPFDPAGQTVGSDDNDEGDFEEEYDGDDE